jgi:uncharacterized damage-inducible protein DinB
MDYEFTAIAGVPAAADPAYQHMLEIYAGETNKVVSVWREFDDSQLDFRPHSRSASVREIFEHQLLSERRFFGEFLGCPEPPAAAVLPAERSSQAFQSRVAELARPRLNFFAAQDAGWWLSDVPFFDVRRQRIWIFWRRVLHTAHHRTQLTVYLRLLDRRVVPTYGPTADVTWSGADPTQSVEAAGRGSQGK